MKRLQLSSALPIRIPARSRVANIRRESNVRSCVENELAVERLVKVSQQVSHTFNDFSLVRSLFIAYLNRLNIIKYWVL